VYAIRCAATERAMGRRRGPIFPTIWDPPRHFAPAARHRDETGRFSPPGTLQRGPKSFAFKILEEIDLEQLTYGRERALKERVQHWREVFGAGRDLTFPATPVRIKNRLAWSLPARTFARAGVVKVCVRKRSRETGRAGSVLRTVEAAPVVPPPLYAGYRIQP